jgi:hypothetical protein
MMNNSMYRTAQEIAATRIAEAQQQRKVAEVRTGSKDRQSRTS